MKPKNLAVTGILAAVICVFAPLAVPIGPVPISLATLAIYIVATAAGWKRGLAATALYILIGAVGIPVYSGFSAGFPKLMGVTGGYIWGYLLLALVAGALADRFSTRFWAYPIGMALGTLLLYACGTVWFMYVTGNSLTATLAVCVVPFLIGDVIKIVIASLAAFKLRHTLHRLSFV
jgi:biotin transport system substrate-specific component